MFGLLNPINHGSSPAAVAKYKVEPYVMAGDVYGAPPHTGRGGWTWYTGSAGWLYRVGLEDMLGFRRSGDRLRIDPCVPKEWKSCELTYRFGKSEYHVTVVNPAGIESGVRAVFVDGEHSERGEIVLADDGKRHEVRVEMG